MQNPTEVNKARRLCGIKINIGPSIEYTKKYMQLPQAMRPLLTTKLLVLRKPLPYSGCFAPPRHINNKISFVRRHMVSAIHTFDPNIAGFASHCQKEKIRIKNLITDPRARFSSRTKPPQALLHNNSLPHPINKMALRRFLQASAMPNPTSTHLAEGQSSKSHAGAKPLA